MKENKNHEVTKSTKDFTIENAENTENYEVILLEKKEAAFKFNFF